MPRIPPKHLAPGTTPGDILTWNGTAWVSTPPKGPTKVYFPLVSGFQSAGSTYTLIGALPLLDWSTLGVGTLTLSLTAIINIPSSSTARVRLYDVTNTSILWESAIISGPQVEYNAGTSPITVAAGSSMLEFWLSTPTITGGSASCILAGLLAVFT